MKHKGFSLVELMVAILVFSLTMMMIMQTFVLLSKTTYALENHTVMNMETRYCMLQLGMDIRGASEIHMFNGQSLSIDVEDFDGDTKLVEYIVSNEKLIRVTDGSRKVIMDNVKSFKITGMDSKNREATELINLKKIKYQFQLETKVVNQIQTYDFYSNIVILRNHKISS